MTALGPVEHLNQLGISRAYTDSTQSEPDSSTFMSYLTSYIGEL